MNININVTVLTTVYILGGLSFVGILISYLKYPEKYERIFYHLLTILSLIPFLRNKLRYRKISSHIQADLNSASKTLDKQSPGILPHAMKIEFAKSGQAVESFLRNGDIIIKMGMSENNESNTVVSTLAYIEKALLFDTRHYVDETLIQATDFTVAKELLSIAKLNRAIAYLMSNCIEPEISANPQLGEDCVSLDTINESGLFSRIFLTQLQFLGKKLWPMTTSAVIRQEVRGFMNYIHDISNQASFRDEELPELDYLHPRIRVRVLLAARKETKQWGLRPYINRIKESQSLGIEYIYLCGWGRENIQFVETIAKDQKEAGRLSIISSNVYDLHSAEGNEFPSICITCAINLRMSAEEALSATDVLRNLLEEHVEELREGKVEVVSLSREPGIVSKIFVKPLVEGVDAVRCFVECYTFGSLSVVFGDEKLIVLPWQEDIESLIAIALLNRDLREQIGSIELNERDKTATVRIGSNEVRSMAVGRKGLNVKIASQLTGWRIDIRQTK